MSASDIGDFYRVLIFDSLLKLLAPNNNNQRGQFKSVTNAWSLRVSGNQIGF